MGGGEESSSVGLGSKNVVQVGVGEGADGGSGLGPWLVAVRQWLLRSKVMEGLGRKGLSQLGPLGWKLG